MIDLIKAGVTKGEFSKNGLEKLKKIFDEIH
ncbi:hypothetical protein M2105_000496 [Paenibacillus sp. PastF-1]|nr:hypothetical protein [Paenibacillus sp. PastF-2]MDF9846081.1 hypothetical protein [Paenibacillus sp. PastM-2]MDF9852654.1 hypothetical protein [Paenibacillus sp. PastF-1]MDH6477615.1 hypothetical protein [Paenibacillus sp. PastH-2]MDH6505358.1 hypothetical protein [Paenibacillus sp. PastM-3]